MSHLRTYRFVVVALGVFVSLFLFLALPAAVFAHSAVLGPASRPLFAAMTLSDVAALALQGSAPLLFLVMGIVQWIKGLGVKGNVLRIASMGTGLVLGGLYLFFTTKPDDPLGFFFVVVYGLLVGLVASGIIDVARDVASRVQAETK